MEGRYYSGNFHLMIGNNRFCEIKATVNTGKEKIKIKPFHNGIHHSVQVRFTDVDEIRKGLDTDQWIELQNRLRHKMSSKLYHFSLVFKATQTNLPGNTLDLIGTDTSRCDEWISRLRQDIAAAKQRELDLRCLLTWYYKHQISAKELFEFNYYRLEQFIHKLNINITSEHLKLILGSHHSSSSIKIHEFTSLVQKFDQRPGLDFIFFKHSIAKSNFMSAHGLQKFFLQEQRTEKSLEECRQLIETYEPKSDQNLYNSTDQITVNTEESYMTRIGFYSMFDNEKEFELFDPSHKNVCQDMTRPMTHYYIASSHNSYLTGNQLSSASSYEMYRKMLLNGCRCVEIDVWNGPNGEPIVKHGYTITTTITLKGILEVIARVAFVHSDYPIILSIENHLSIEQQQVMAQMMINILGDALYINPVSTHISQFPSPYHFRRKIVVKGSKNELFEMPEQYNWLTKKRAQRTLMAKRSRDRRIISKQASLIFDDFDDDDEVFDEEDVNRLQEWNEQTRWMSQQMSQLWNNTRFGVRGNNNTRIDVDQSTLGTNNIENGVNCSTNQIKTIDQIGKTKFSSERNPLSQIEEEGEEEENDGINETFELQSNRKNSKSGLFSKHISVNSSKSSSTKSQKSSIKVHPQFSSLINYFQTKKYINIDDCLHNFEFYQMISRDENGSMKIFKEDPCSYRHFTSTNMVRVYPHGLRQNSSNYMPLDHWDMGSQLVALNYQTISVPMLINLAQFAMNGGCGYVLKPDFLRKPDQVLPPTERGQSNGKVTMLAVQIICGQFWNQFNASNILLKVSTRVYGPDKHKRLDLKVPRNTKQIKGNGFNPVWNETFTFDLNNPALSFVQFILVNNNYFVGHYMIAFQALQKGYRRIELFDHELKLIPFAHLFVHIDHWEESIQVEED